ncbi:PDZ domain-containing protein [Flavobacteriaceae bacterium AU392]|nr:PDZ domain-containing protein [Flavobacteriaceae bacterium]RKM86128.1 PDZ domain-containing protein [Flavobacteriaceae bacterium AU392]
MKKTLTLILVSALGGVLTLVGYKTLIEPNNSIAYEEVQQPVTRFIPASYSTTNTNLTSLETPDFVFAADKTIHSVVHVKNTAKSNNSGLTAFELFFSGGRESRPQIGTGSGVIISPDGYIITNNHVIEGAESISITTNDNKIYEANLVGTDPKTDIALLKIDADEDLPYTAFGDSDTAKIGEWVLAVGNPFNLTSTVTAGIISAKSRDLDKRGRNTQSFIQTDAAVNPGNSGGALVNINGDLIGINTAITSQTGSYVGYSFAVPSNIARKVVEDLLEFGNVQNGILGVSGEALNSENAAILNIDITEGFHVSDVEIDSGADKAGVKSGDVIKKLDDVKISKFSDLRGYLGAKRPNDIVNLTIQRGNTEKIIPVTLSKSEISTIEILDMNLRNIPQGIKDEFGLDNGVIISNTENYQLYRNYGVKTGYIITHINDTPIKKISDINKLKEKYGTDFEKKIYKIKVLNRSGEQKREITLK